jgi:phage terminase large subunit-like protein
MTFSGVTWSGCDPLFPELKPLDFLLDRKKLLTQPSWESIYQQHPIVVGGGQFPIDKLKVLPIFDQSKITHTIRYWDKAASDTEDASFTAGVCMHAMSDGTFVISHIARGQWTALDREQRIRTWTEADAAQFSNYEVYVEQEPGSGGKESAESTVRHLAGHRVYADKVTGHKEVRCEPLAAQVQGGNVHLVAGEWVSAFLDECVAGDTKIMTISGQREIDTIQAGDLVMTREGWRPVIKAGCTGRKQLCEISLSNGQRLRTTLDHPIFVPGYGFKKAGTLKVGESLLQYIGMPFLDSINRDILAAGSTVQKHERSYSIATFGSVRLARSLLAITSTIRTGIDRILRWPTLNAFLLASTTRFRIFASGVSALFVALASMLRSGGMPSFALPNAVTAHTRFVSASTTSNALRAARTRWAGGHRGFAVFLPIVGRRIEEKLGAQSNAFNAEATSLQAIQGSFVANSVLVSGLRMLDGIHDVYNLSVLGKPEFVANGCSFTTVKFFLPALSGRIRSTPHQAHSTSWRSARLI